MLPFRFADEELAGLAALQSARDAERGAVKRKRWGFDVGDAMGDSEHSADNPSYSKTSRC